MADRRLIAQSITNSGQVAQLVRQCGPWAATFFTWALTFIDDDSRFEGDPETLRHRILGRYLDLVSPELVAEIVALMNDVDLALWYEVIGSPGERYLYFPRFTTHQTLREDRYGPSRLPAPPSWTPEEGHPYTKNAARRSAWKPGQQEVRDLRQDKPQRDLRRTVRVPKRPVIKGESAALATSAQPPRDQSATTARPPGDQQVTSPHPLGHAAGTEDAPRPASSRLATEDSSRLATAEPSLSRVAEELRSRGRTRGLTPLSSVVTTVTRDTMVGAHYRSLTDLSTDPGWPASKPAPGMFADGRVRDRFGNVHASTTEFYAWARREAEQLAEAELKVSKEKSDQEATEAAAAQEDEPGIAETSS